MPAVDAFCDVGSGGDIDLALFNFTCCICSGKCCTVDIRDGAARNVRRVLGRIACACAYVGTVGIGDRAAGDCDDILCGIARGAQDGGVFDHAATRVQRRTAACERQLVFLYFVAIRCHVRLVVVRMDAPARTRIAVARTKVDVAAVLHERQDAVACLV